MQGAPVNRGAFLERHDGLLISLFLSYTRP